MIAPLGFIYLCASLTIPGLLFSRDGDRVEDLILRSLFFNALTIPIAYFLPIAGYAQILLISLGLIYYAYKRPSLDLEVDPYILIIAASALAFFLIADRDYIQFYLRYALAIGLTGYYPFYFPERMYPEKPPFVVSGPLVVYLIGSLIRLFGTGRSTLHASKAFDRTILVGLLYLSKRMNSLETVSNTPTVLSALLITAGLLDPPLTFLVAYIIYSLKEKDRNKFRLTVSLLPFVKIWRVAIYGILVAYALFGLIKDRLPKLSRIIIGISAGVLSYALGAFRLASVISAFLISGAFYKAFKSYTPIRANARSSLLVLPLIHLIRTTIVSGTPLGEYYYVVFKNTPAYQEYSYRYIEAAPTFSYFKTYNVIAYLRHGVTFYAPAAVLLFYYALRKRPTGVDAFIAFSLLLLAIPMPRNPRHFMRLRTIIALVSDDEKAKVMASVYLLGSIVAIVARMGTVLRVYLAILTLVSLAVPYVTEIRIRKEVALGLAVLYMRSLYHYGYGYVAHSPIGLLGNYYEYVDDILAYNVTGLVYDGAPGLEYILNASIPAIPLFQPILYEHLRDLLHSYDPQGAFEYLNKHHINAFLYPYPYKNRRPSYKIRFLHDFLHVPYNRILLGPTYERHKLGDRYYLFVQKHDHLVPGLQAVYLVIRDDNYEYVAAAFDYTGTLVAYYSKLCSVAGSTVEIRAIFLGDPGDVYIRLGDAMVKAHVERHGSIYIATFEFPKGTRTLRGIEYEKGSVRFVAKIKRGVSAYVTLSRSL